MNKLFQWIKKIRRKSLPLYRTGWSGDSYISIEGDAVWTSGKKKKDKRIVKKPVEVFKEIISQIPKINLTGLAEQIKIVEKRKDFMENELEIQCQDEVEALNFLKARKKYIEYKDEFKWSIATLSAVEKLCEKYKLRVVDFKNYYKNVPMEGIEELEKFLKAYRKVRNDEPVLKLVIDYGGKEQKKDPILLASSPFGKWWIILGAWDKEVAVVDELIYRGK